MFEGLERFERFASWFRRESASNSTGKTATYRFVQQPPGALGHGWVGESNPAVLRSYRPPAFQTRTTTGTSFSVAIPKENANSYHKSPREEAAGGGTRPPSRERANYEYPSRERVTNVEVYQGTLIPKRRPIAMLFSSWIFIGGATRHLFRVGLCALFWGMCF